MLVPWWLVNGLRKLGGSCNVSSDALAAYKRETDKQKPKHPREKAKIGGRRRRPISLLLHLSSNVQDAIWRLALEMHYWPSDELLGEAQKFFFCSPLTFSRLTLTYHLLLIFLPHQVVRLSTELKTRYVENCVNSEFKRRFFWELELQNICITMAQNIIQWRKCRMSRLLHT